MSNNIKPEELEKAITEYLENYVEDIEEDVEEQVQEAELQEILSIIKVGL